VGPQLSDFAALNGDRVVSGRISVPSSRLWTADVVTALSQDIPETPGGLTLTLGNVTFTGTVFREATYGGVRSVRVVGGFGGWRNTLAARYYALPAGVPLSMVLSDAASELGEPTPTIASPLAGTNVGPAFTRPAEPGTYVLEQLATPYWWMQPNGTIYVGARATGPITSTFQVTEYHGRSGMFTVYPDVIGDWMPGRSFSTPQIGTPNPVSYVEFVIAEDGKLRAEVLVS
jgi:hypothetical protein